MQMSGRHTVTALSRHSQLAAIFIGRSTPQHRPALERRAQRYVYAQHQYCRHAGSEAAPRTLLDVLRSRSTVDCDTLDASVASSLGPFQDCTSNQAIAFAELQEHRHSDLVRRSASLAEELIPRYRDDGVSRDALAVEIRMVSLGLEIVPHLKGNMHIQVNPFDAYSSSRTILGSERILSLFKDLSPDFDTSRVCIKIPSTWEGLQACRVLEQEKGIKTLATTLFGMPQAMLAAEVGCRYIAPYVNELKVHIDPKYKDLHPHSRLCHLAQRYYENQGLKTQVLPASLVSVEECMAMAGVHHITIAPPLLTQLSKTTAPEDLEGELPSLFDRSERILDPIPERRSYLNEEAEWRMALTRSIDGEDMRKLIQALNILCIMQSKLEDMMTRVMETA